MKFCPNCGFPLEVKKVCNCGYNIETNEVDIKRNEEYNIIIKDNYERQCDNFQMGLGMSFGNQDLIMEQKPIFNKEPDIIMGRDYIEQMKKLHKDIEDAKKDIEN